MRAASAFALLLLGFMNALPTLASSYTIFPVSVHLPYGKNSASLNVQNGRPAALSVQVRIYRWTQDGDTDVLTPTSDVILSPPMAIIAGNAAQTLRLLMRKQPGAATDQERHYRILLDEVPDAKSRPGQLSFAMRSSIPVFVNPQHPLTASLAWRAARDQDGVVILTGTNTGLAYDQVVSLAATTLDGAALTTVLRGTNPYVLPGAQRRWAVREKITGDMVHLTVVTVKGRSDQSLPIDR
jgi:fimbrial chaperone protein